MRVAPCCCYMVIKSKQENREFIFRQLTVRFSILTQLLGLPHIWVHSTIVERLITAGIWSVISVPLQQLVFGFLCLLNQTWCTETLGHRGDLKWRREERILQLPTYIRDFVCVSLKTGPTVREGENASGYIIVLQCDRFIEFQWVSHKNHSTMCYGKPKQKIPNQLRGSQT